MLGQELDLEVLALVGLVSAQVELAREAMALESGLEGSDLEELEPGLDQEGSDQGALGLVE